MSTCRELQRWGRFLSAHSFPARRCFMAYAHEPQTQQADDQPLHELINDVMHYHIHSAQLPG